MEMNNIISESPLRRNGNNMVRIVNEILTRIKEEIKQRKGLTQKKVAKRIGLKQSEFSKILAGKRPFKVPQLVEIAKVLNMKIHEFIPGDEIIDIEKMPMLDLIRVIVKQEIEKYLKEG